MAEIVKWRKFFFIVWGILSTVYLPLILRFIWGNHDWDYLNKTVTLSDGFFESRYSQHLFNSFLFDGQILPVFFLLWGAAALVVSGIMISYYLKVDKEKRVVWGLTLFIGLNPYLFGTFYYLMILNAMTFWPIVAIWLLMMTEKGFSWRRLFLGGSGYGILWGGYPALFSFSAGAFCLRQIIESMNGKLNWSGSFKKGFFLAMQVCIGFVIFKLINYYLVRIGVVNTDMYNLKLRDFSEILEAIIKSFYTAFGQFGTQYLYLEKTYSVLLIGGIIGAVLMWGRKRNKVLTLVWFAALLLFSQFAFILAQGADIARFRIEYWTRFPICLFILYFLLIEKKRWLRNFVSLWMVLLIGLFVQTDFWIQKNWHLGFESNLKYQSRVKDRIITDERFNPQTKYIAYNFGQVNFSNKFYGTVPNDIEKSMELENLHTFDIAVVKNMFWGTDIQPIGVGVVKLDEKNFLYYSYVKGFRAINPKGSLPAIRKWIYTEAQPYPSKDFIYLDNNFMVVVLKETDFYKNRENLLVSFEGNL